MKLEEINSFIAVSKHLNISHAARSMGISSTACKYNIISLETELGVQLIQSSPGQQTVTFTEQGHRFIPLAYRWAELWADTRGEFFPLEKPTYSVAMGKSLYSYLINRIHVPLVQAFAPTQLFLSTPSYDQTLLSMMQGRTQLALFTFSRHPSYTTALPIISEEYMFLCAKGSHYPYLLSSKELCVDDEIYVGRNVNVSTGDSLTAWHRTHFSERGKPLLMCDSVEFLPHFLSNGSPGAWSVVPVSVGRAILSTGEVESRLMADGPLPRTIYAISSQYELYSENTTRFFGCIRSYLGHQPGIQLLI